MGIFKRKQLVKDTFLVGAIKFCPDCSSPMYIRKCKPEYDNKTGRVNTYFYEISCSKFWCWNHHMIWWHWVFLDDNEVLSEKAISL